MASQIDTSDVLSVVLQQNVRAVSPRSRIEKDDFLKLLFTQLKYQDFESSVDYKELMGQLSILAEIEQAMNLNKQLEELSRSIANMNFFYASSTLGKSAFIYGDKLYVSEGKSEVKPGFILDVPAKDVYVRVKTTGGATIRTIKLSNLQAGKHYVDWDTKNDAGNTVSDGEYYFEVEAYDSSGNKFRPKKVVLGKVESISLEDGKVFLGVGKSGKYRLEDILELKI